MSKKDNTVKLIILGIAVAILFFTCFRTSLGALEGIALNVLGVVIATLLLLVFDVFPVPITCLLAVIFLVVFRCVNSIGEAFTGYSNHILYFTLASFGLSTALSKTSLSKRLLLFLMNHTRPTAAALLRAIMLCNAILSSIISNVAAVLIFLPLVDDFLECYEDPSEKARTGRTYMIGLLLSSMIGGMMTPAGSSINLLTLNALEQYAGKYVGFVQWMGVGIPIALAVLTLAYTLTILIYPPVELPYNVIERFKQSIKVGDITSKDIYTLVVVLGAIFFWILSSWIPQIHITVVAIAALALLFLPKYQVMDWDSFNRSISWETYFIAGTMITIANSVVNSGLANYAVNLMFPAKVELPFLIVAAMVAFITFIFMIFIPSAPAAISILGPFVTEFALNNNYNPIILVMICGFCVSNCFLLPLDTPAMVIYSRRAFKMFELPRVTAILQIGTVVLMALIVPTIGRLLNLC